MRILKYLVVTFLLSPAYSNAQILKFKAVSVQVIVNDKYGNYLTTGKEESNGDGPSIEINLDNGIITSTNPEMGNYALTGMENYVDTFKLNWTVFKAVDKKGNHCTIRLLIYSPAVGNLYDAKLFLDTKETVIVYKLIKDFK
jgi:hypothetical protein